MPAMPCSLPLKSEQLPALPDVTTDRKPKAVAAPATSNSVQYGRVTMLRRPLPGCWTHVKRWQRNVKREMTQVMAGVNTAHREAYRQMLAAGFRITVQGLAMDQPDEAACNHDGVYVIDDWR
jgi:hypothetical protein